MLTSNWPVPIASYHCSDARDINLTLSRVFQTMRIADSLDENSKSGDPKKFYASNDQLLQRIDIPEFSKLIQFFADSIQKTVGAANAGIWPQGKMVWLFMMYIHMVIALGLASTTFRSMMKQKGCPTLKWVPQMA